MFSKRFLACGLVCLVTLLMLLPTVMNPPPARADTFEVVGSSGLNGTYGIWQSSVAAMSTYGGELYAATNSDFGQCRIWRYKEVSETWTQVNTDGFGDPYNKARSMCVYGGQLYVGTYNIKGCEVWTTEATGGPPYTDWTMVNTNGFGDKTNASANCMKEYGQYMYVGTRNYDSGCQVWRYDSVSSQWTKVRGNGFGTACKEVRSMTEFNGNLYVGTTRLAGGGQIWGYNGTTWWSMVTDGFGDSDNFSIDSLGVYGAHLYAGTNNNLGDGCEVRVYNSPVWKLISKKGFGDKNNTSATTMRNYNGLMFVGTFNDESGAELWGYSGGGIGGWQQYNDDGFGSKKNDRVGSLQVWSGDIEGSRLFVGVSNEDGAVVVRDRINTPSYKWKTVSPVGFCGNTNAETTALLNSNGFLFAGTYSARGCQVLRYDGSDWAQANTDGFGTNDNDEVASMAMFGGYLYVGTQNESTGCEVWRTRANLEPPYDDWEQVNQDGFGDSDNVRACSMQVWNGALHVGTKRAGGCQVWRTLGGDSWDKLTVQNGFGDVNNTSVCSMTVFNDGLTVGTSNATSGCQVWHYWNSWTRVGNNGFGEPNNTDALSMAVLDSSLYVGTYNFYGFQVWNSGGLGIGGAYSDWTKVFIGNQPQLGVYSMEVLGSQLYAGTYSDNGFCAYKTNGTWSEGAQTWDTVMVNGYDSQNNLRAMSMAVISPHLYIGTYNEVDGCGVIGVKGNATTWYLAEGASSGDFETWVLVQNPHEFPVDIEVTFQTGSSEVPGPAEEIPARSRKSYRVNEYVQTYDVSTIVRCPDEFEIICERSMYGANRVWGHDSIGVTVPSSTWYLAEGATEGGFETWVLVQNPQETPANVEIDFQTDQGEVPGPSEQIPARSRKSYRVNDYVQTYDVSTRVSADCDIVCERSMYGGSRTWGHDSIGVTSPGTIWYLAEGCTGGDFETWVLVQNPEASPVDVTLTFQTDQGEVPGPSEQIPARSRKSYRVNDYVQTYDVSTQVNSSGGSVVCERSMYGGNKTWGHDSIGVTTSSPTWYLAEGCTGGDFETWILVQNPGASWAAIAITFQTGSGEVQGPTELIAPLSRRSFRVNDFVQDYNVSTTVTSQDGTTQLPYGIICERSMYGGNRTWGHDSIGYAP